MKYLLITLSTIFIFGGCSKNGAFEDFNLTKEQERSMNSLQSAKIRDAKTIDGMISAIYLNEVYPNTYNYHEYFFVYRYNKTKSELNLKLNSNSPIKVKKLSSKNEFSELIGVESEWNEYYLVSFEHQDTKKLSLVLESGQFSSDPLVYLKER